MLHWDALDRLPGWSVHFADTGHAGLCRWDDMVILLDPNLGHRDEKCVLMHEAVHAERGPFPRWALPREEEAVSREASRRLLPRIDAVADALLWSHNLHEAADELDVDVPTLEARLRATHPSERHYLRRRLQEEQP